MIKKIDIAGLQLDNYTVREMLMSRQAYFRKDTHYNRGSEYGYAGIGGV